MNHSEKNETFKNFQIYIFSDFMRTLGFLDWLVQWYLRKYDLFGENNNETFFGIFYIYSFSDLVRNAGFLYN